MNGAVRKADASGDVTHEVVFCGTTSGTKYLPKTICKTNKRNSAAPRRPSRHRALYFPDHALHLRYPQVPWLITRQPRSAAYGKHLFHEVSQYLYLTANSSSNPPKYRCPRCPAVRTCSLPCYKRHQQRATCTGRRNETTYVKKSQLATPAAIDHDYNFLAKIERSFRSAEEQSDENRTSKRRRLASNPAFNGYLLENHITVHTAPLGLQRAKTNQSRFLPKSKRVAWTVEWVGEAAVTCTTEVYDNDTVWTAYTTMAARFFNGKRKG